MASPRPSNRLPAQPRGLSAPEGVAIVLTIVWLGLSGWYIISSPGPDLANLRFLLAVLVILMPIALIWLAVLTMRSSRILREETARLQTAIDAIRQAYVTQSQTLSENGRNDAPHPAIMKRLDDLSGATRNLETTIAMLGGMRQAEAQITTQTGPDPAAEEDQPSLSLGTTVEDMLPPLSNADFIRALHFPETAEDEEGFAALRRALKSRTVGHLVQAAQDILTLLSQDGIYMDDLRPDLARPETWRAFATGERGREIADLGGVRDRSSLALAAGRMKQDPIFRDAAHHFLRRFDKCYADFANTASDEEINAFGGTRTARAFMLLGRVAGTFD
ncbi:MAG: alkaline shock response membrane anchor protein AmaP [Pelagimonas sp.]|jgi:hypothetical protein|nr:alkaline shock response membrane anchor protein AmaP [Pelagimonas sp.]